MSSVGSHSIPRADGHWLLGSAKEFAHSPHRFVAELGRQKGSLVQFRVLHKRFLATANPEVAYQVLVSHRERYERGAHYKRIATVTGNGLLVSEGAKWRKRHQIIQPLLRGERLKRLVPTVCDSVSEVLRYWETKRINGAPIEVVGETQRLTISAIGRILLSTNIGQEAASRLGTALREAMLLLRRHNTSLFALPLGCPIHRNRRLHDHSQFLDRFIESHVEARRRGGQPETNDFLSVLMAAEDPDSGEKLPAARNHRRNQDAVPGRVRDYLKCDGLDAISAGFVSRVRRQVVRRSRPRAARPNPAVGRPAANALHRPGPQRGDATVSPRTHAGAPVYARR